jgi:hypothetical protein
MLHQTEQALVRLENGTYGFCEDTGDSEATHGTARDIFVTRSLAGEGASIQLTALTTMTPLPADRTGAGYGRLRMNSQRERMRKPLYGSFLL